MRFSRGLACIALAAAFLALRQGAGAQPGSSGDASAAAVDAVSVPTRAGAQYLELRQSDGSYKPIYVKGMNLSVALPGFHPSEFPHDEQLYLDWLERIAAMNCNVIRLYTILPPPMYTALLAYNTAHPEKPLWLIQGVWVEPPPQYNFLDAAFMAEVQMNTERAIDLVHGNAQFEDRPGWTGGKYTADVSPWLLAWLLGREWEPDDIQGFTKLRPDLTSYQGQLISCPQGQPIECWLAQLCDYGATYEQQRYSVQHPTTFSSWPPTDPLSHISESNIEDESEIATAAAEGRTDVFSSDAVNISSKSFRAEPDFKSGIYASYHVYPYWPDFIDNEPAYQAARDRQGPSSYFGYLGDLKAYYNDRPLLIAEYGLPNGPFPAHMQSQGWNHGGSSEAQVAQYMPRLSEDIYDTGCAGGIVFAWIDEWFKKCWVWAEMYDPFMDRRLWYSDVDAEKNYGMQAMLPGANGPTCTLSGNAAEWQAASVRPGQGAAVGDSAPQALKVSMMHDEGYLYVRIELPQFSDWEFTDTGLYLGLDVLGAGADGADRGNTQWPAPLNLASDSGLETVITLAGGQARLWQTESFRYWEPYRVAYSMLPQFAEVLPHILVGEANRRAWFEPALEINRRRVGRDGSVYPARFFYLNPLPRGTLKPGPEYNDLAYWDVNPQAGVVELRLPWILIGFVGPHQLRVLQAKEDGTNGSEISPGVGLAVVLASATGKTLAAWPGYDGQAVTTSAAGRYTWPAWDTPDIKYHSRPKPVYGALRDLFGTLGNTLPPPPMPSSK